MSAGRHAVVCSRGTRDEANAQSAVKPNAASRGPVGRRNETKGFPGSQSCRKDRQRRPGAAVEHPHDPLPARPHRAPRASLMRPPLRTACHIPADSPHAKRNPPGGQERGSKPSRAVPPRRRPGSPEPGADVPYRPKPTPISFAHQRRPREEAVGVHPPSPAMAPPCYMLDFAVYRPPEEWRLNRAQAWANGPGWRVRRARLGGGCGPAGVTP